MDGDKFAWFWAKVARGEPDQCWPWLGFKKKSGHGLTTHKSLPIHTSRLAWLLINGPIGRDLCVNHKCDFAACCNPAHLYLGTRADNAIDRWTRPKPEYRKTGRKCVLSDEQLEAMYQMRREGKTLKECAQMFDVHIATICRYITKLRRAKLEKLLAVRLSQSHK